MTKKYLIDSVILIDHLNKIEQATQWLSIYGEHAFISVITRAEILVGFNDDRVEVIKNFLDQFELLDITKCESDLAAKLRREQKWKLPDAFQAALAQNHTLTLVTRNTKDFCSKKHSFVFIPYEL